MSPAAITVLALSMSIDALLASVGRGAGLRGPHFSEAIRTGVIFGFVEMLTPVIGWTAGIAASAYVQAVDHWIAFALLAAVGGRMVLHAFRKSDVGPPAEPNRSVTAVFATAIGTSIDAMAVGVSLAFLDVNIIVIAAAIGLATCIMSTGGIMMGGLIGTRFGRWAEIVGGVALVGLGFSILFNHLSA
jgi:manganese efflux pump family protein